MSRRKKTRAAGNAKRGKIEHLEEKQHVLKAQIGALEGFIAGAPARSRAHGIQNRDTLPAPEMLRRRPGPKVMLGVEALLRRARQRRHFFQFLMLLGIWASVASWLWFFWINAG